MKKEKWLAAIAAGHARVWLDIVAVSARGDMAYRETDRAIMDGLIAWVMKRLPDGEYEATARALLTVLEGTLVIDAVGHAEAADTAVAWFSGDGGQ